MTCALRDPRFPLQIISRRLETEGPEVSAQLSVLSEAIDIFSTLRPTLPNNDKIEKLTKTLFMYVQRSHVSDTRTTARALCTGTFLTGEFYTSFVRTLQGDPCGQFQSPE